MGVGEGKNKPKGHVKMDSTSPSKKKRVCGTCGKVIMLDPQYTLAECAECGKPLCPDCVEPCIDCDDDFCRDCLAECKRCLSLVCSICRSTCDSCGAVFCEYCTDLGLDFKCKWYCWKCYPGNPADIKQTHDPEEYQQDWNIALKTTNETESGNTRREIGRQLPLRAILPNAADLPAGTYGSDFLRIRVGDLILVTFRLSNGEKVTVQASVEEKFYAWFCPEDYGLAGDEPIESA